MAMNGPTEIESQILCNQMSIMSALHFLVSTSDNNSIDKEVLIDSLLASHALSMKLIYPGIDVSKILNPINKKYTEDNKGEQSK